MLITLPALQPTRLPAGEELKLIPPNNNFEIGQILKAVVVAGLGESRLMLNIDGANINAKAEHPLNPGEELTVKVEKEAGQIILRVLDKKLSELLINQGLRHVLPKQAPATQLFNLIQAIHTLPTPLMNKLPAPILNQLDQLIKSLPNFKQLSNSVELKQAITHAGIFLESKLSNPTFPPSLLSKDFKGQLLKLLHIIDQSLKSMGIPPNLPSTKVLNPWLGVDLKNATTLSFKERQQLERAARLQHTANFQPSKYKQLTSGITSLSANRHTAHTNAHTDYLKHSPLPIRGAIPQPLKPLEQPLLSQHDPKQMLLALKEESTSVLSRLQANQLSSLPKDQLPPNLLMLEIPVKLDKNTCQVIPFLIKEEKNNTYPDKEKHWSITFAVEMENLGALQIKVSLLNKKVDINVWSEQDETVKLLEENAPKLKAIFEKALIPLGNLFYHHGLKENEIDSKTFRLLELSI